MVITYTALTLCSLFAVAVGVGCPNGFIPHKASCHAAIRQLATWAEAREYCAAVGAGLSHVETVEEQHYLEGLVKSVRGNYWLGGFDQLEENIWIWDTNRTRIETFFWYPGKPNGGPSHNCLYMERQYHYKWSDYTCGSRMYFVCERPAQVVKHTVKNVFITVTQGTNPAEG
ncbi:perlucin-like [Gigantopelta aegis]|uniref:perlucin-like n=1 Tax=Gigantopelta aegis TaxID=1735272 RepID=UPI001B887F58|nr:perlucin-like [Gigantopelta aegis]